MERYAGYVNMKSFKGIFLLLMLMFMLEIKRTEDKKGKMRANKTYSMGFPLISAMIALSPPKYS